MQFKNLQYQLEMCIQSKEESKIKKTSSVFKIGKYKELPFYEPGKFSNFICRIYTGRLD